MAVINNAASLTILMDELSAVLQQAEAAFEDYLAEPNKACQEHLAKAFHQIAGVCSIIDLLAVSRAAQELEALSLNLNKVQHQERAQAALSNGIILLSQYLEYVQQVNQSRPALLTGLINQIRIAYGASRIYESEYVALPITASFNVEPVSLSAVQIAELQRLRHMYQVGLLAVLKQNHIGLKIMARAAQQIYRLLTPAAQSVLWWLVQGVLQGLNNNELLLTDTRQHLFTQFDRQLRSIIKEGDAIANQPANNAMVKESLYLVSLCRSSDGVIGQIKETYQIITHITDTQLQAEISLMYGGGSSLYKTVASELEEELMELRRTLEMAAIGEKTSGFAEVANSMRDMSSTLVILEKPEVAELVSQRADIVAAWNSEDVDYESGEVAALVDDLVVLGNTVASIKRQYAPTVEAQDECNNETISCHVLDSARLALIRHCRTNISKVKSALVAYIDNHNDAVYAEEVPLLVEGIIGGLDFLQLSKPKAVMESCDAYIKQTLLNTNASVATSDNMELLADAISSVDYYLEGLETDKPIGDMVIEIAEKSLVELGFAVQGK